MILSAELLLSDDQAITATAASTNYIDLGAAGTPQRAQGPLDNDPGPGTGVPFECIVTQAFDLLTTLTVDLEMDDNTAFSSATTVVTVDVPLADLTVGKNIFANLNLPTGITERYVRLNYTVTGTNPTVGQITAGVSGGRQTNT